MLLIMVLNKLLKFLLNMDLMLIFKTKFSFSFFFSFSFYFFCFFSFFFICCCGFIVGFMLIVNCCVVIYIYIVFILFLTTFFLLKSGWTALHNAAWKGFEQIAKILVEHGSNVDLQTSEVLIFIFISFVFSLFLNFCCGSLLGCFVLIVNGCVLCDIDFVFILFLTTLFC